LLRTDHFNKGKEYAAQGSEVNQMEAKEHDLIFDDSDKELPLLPARLSIASLAYGVL